MFVATKISAKSIFPAEALIKEAVSLAELNSQKTIFLKLKATALRIMAPTFCGSVIWSRIKTSGRWFLSSIKFNSSSKSNCVLNSSFEALIAIPWWTKSLWKIFWKKIFSWTLTIFSKCWREFLSKKDFKSSRLFLLVIISKIFLFWFLRARKQGFFPPIQIKSFSL